MPAHGRKRPLTTGAPGPSMQGTAFLPYSSQVTAECLEMPVRPPQCPYAHAPNPRA